MLGSDHLIFRTMICQILETKLVGVLIVDNCLLTGTMPTGCSAFMLQVRLQSEAMLLMLTDYVILLQPRHHHFLILHPHPNVLHTQHTVLLSFSLDSCNTAWMVDNLVVVYMNAYGEFRVPATIQFSSYEFSAFAIDYPVQLCQLLALSIVCLSSWLEMYWLSSCTNCFPFQI